MKSQIINFSNGSGFENISNREIIRMLEVTQKNLRQTHLDAMVQERLLIQKKTLEKIAKQRGIGGAQNLPPQKKPQKPNKTTRVFPVSHTSSQRHTTPHSNIEKQKRRREPSGSKRN